MIDNEQGNDGEDAGQEPNETPAADETPGADPQGGQQSDPLADLPEWAQREIKDLRTEAASRRTKLREAEAALSAAKTPDEVAAAVAEYTAKIDDLNDEIARRDVASTYRLPGDLAALLPRKADEATLKSAAEALARYVTAGPVRTPRTPGGGVDPDGDAGPFDAQAELEKIRRIG